MTTNSQYLYRDVQTVPKSIDLSFLLCFLDKDKEEVKEKGEEADQAKEEKADEEKT